MCSIFIRARKTGLWILLACAGLACAVYGAYIPTNRDTKMPPERVTYELADTGGYEFLSRAGNLEFWYREDRDIFLLRDSDSGYEWKTGLDAPFGADADKQAKNARTDAEKAAVEPKEDRLNATYIGMANSLITAELYDDAFNIQIVSSAGQKGASSKLVSVEENHYRLDAEWADIDLRVKVHVYLTDSGLRYVIYDEDITGEGAYELAALIITPFLGASGGAASYYDPETGKFGEKTAKPAKDGYALVPDGSGALIRFRDNNVALRKYVGSVYGINPAEATMAYNWDNLMSVPKKEPLMPVFGIAQGNEQGAFVAWADGGAEHMEIVMLPEENMTYYNYCYPRFIYNKQFHQVYNRKGEGYYRLLPDRLHFGVDMTYTFLSGASADYVGMALTYRKHLLETGVLNESKVDAGGDVPLRLDFLMSDVKKSIVGTAVVVTTTVSQAGDILKDLHGNGVLNINSGLMGFQKGGATTGKPWTISYDGDIGRKGDFKKLFSEMSSLGVDVSLSQDYARINELQMLLPRNQAYHANHWGIRGWIEEEDFLPVTEISYARPDKSAEWFKSQSRKAMDAGAKSATASGMTSLLVSHYSNSETITAENAAEIYENAFESVSRTGMKINASSPNMFLWKTVDRFLNTPVLNTQYILETDTVPFLELVLNGTMEMYAPYSNFSFYTQTDVLRMIDYNVYPSFIVTAEPAHLLSVTNSMLYYSTEYSIYRDIITKVYAQVNEALSAVKGVDWTDRRVLADGLIVNTYANGVKIYINYTGDGQVLPDGGTVSPLSASVRGAGQ